MEKPASFVISRQMGQNPKFYLKTFKLLQYCSQSQVEVFLSGINEILIFYILWVSLQYLFYRTFLRIWTNFISKPFYSRKVYPNTTTTTKIFILKTEVYTECFLLVNIMSFYHKWIHNTELSYIKYEQKIFLLKKLHHFNFGDLVIVNRSLYKYIPCS